MNMEPDSRAKSGQSPGHVNIEGPPIELPVLTVGLGQRYFITMNQNKDKLHQVDALTGITETKNSVRSRAIRVAIELRNRDIQEKHVVLICSQAHLDQAVVLLACLFVGVIIAPIETELPYDDFKRIIGILQPKVAFCGNRSARLLQRTFKERNIKCTIFTFSSDGKDKDFLEFSKCLENKEDPNFAPTEIQDPKKKIAFIVATHGTEREPKLVALSHYSILMRYLPIIQICKKSEKLLTFFPLGWVSQIAVSCSCFETQTKLIYAGQFTERAACKYIQDLRIDVVFLDGNFAVKIARNAPIQDFDLSCLKIIYIGGMHLGQPNFYRIVKTFRGVNIINCYTTIESGIVANLTEQIFINNRDKLNSAGQVYPGVSIKILDSNRQSLTCDRWGDLYVKTPGLMLGYYGDQLSTNKAFNRGYFKTGDIGQYDSDGFLYLRGRICDNIKREGHAPFSATEVEDIIRLNSAVEEVAVFATAKDIVACVVKKPGHDLTTQSLMDFVQDMLPLYKHPTDIDFYEYLPKTLHGQVKKYILKENALKVIREESFYHSEHVDDI